MPAYTSEPGFPISDAMSGESWTLNGDSLVADNELCTEAGSECTGEPSEPIYLRVDEYNPLVPGGMDDTSDVFEVTLTDPQSYGDGQYLSVTKSLYVTYIRNNYWSDDKRNNCTNYNFIC